MAPIKADELTTTLDHGIAGSTYLVEYLDLPGSTSHRLESLGMTPGIPIEVLNNKSHGTVIIRLRETRFALGRGISSGIHIRQKDDPARQDAAADAMGHEGVRS